MVGFLGTQSLLSATFLGANVEEHSTITLKNGTVITGYYSSNSGPMVLYSFTPKTQEIKQIGGFGDFSSSFGDPHLVATDDGGFRVVYNLKALNGGLFYSKYDASGAEQGSVKTLLTGWIDNAQTYETDTGFFVSYRDRSADAETEYVGAFYNNAGKLLKTIDFAEGASDFGFRHPEPQATLLSNGNLAVVWQKTNLDGSVLQIFKPNGNKVGGEKALGNIPLTSHPQVIDALPGGGFVVAHAPFGTDINTPNTYGPIIIQKYANSSKKLGKEISFDTDGDIGARITSLSNFDVAYTTDGLIAIAWTGTGQNATNGTDVYFAMLTASGKVIVGPQVADVTLDDNQLDVQFNRLKNGDLYLTFKDDDTLQFNYVSSIQGRFIVKPDFLYEGDDKADEIYGEDGADTLNGGKGADVLYGGGGNDVINGGAGSDQAYGGAGNDTIKGGAGSVTLYGGDGRDKITAGTANSTLYGEAGVDRLQGGKANDALWGGAGKDKLSGAMVSMCCAAARATTNCSVVVVTMR